MWFDFTENLLKWSDDNGTNWVTFDGAGPIAEYYGDGTKVVSLTPYAPVGFLTREELQNIYQQSALNMMPDLSAGVSISNGDTLPIDALVVLEGNPSNFSTITLSIDGVTVWAGGVSEGSSRYRVGSVIARKGSVVTHNASCTYYPLFGASL